MSIPIWTHTLFKRPNVARSKGFSPTTDKIAAQMKLVMFCGVRAVTISRAVLAILIAQNADR